MPQSSAKYVLILASLLFSLTTCQAPLTDTESQATQIKLAETMIAETAAFETKLQVAIQNTLEAQPTRTPTSTTESKAIAVTVKFASNTQTPPAILTPTPETTATLDIIPKGKEKHRADLILLCKALQNFAQLDYEYNQAVNNWEPNFEDNDFGPELSELAIFDKALNILISATYELPKTKVADAIAHNDKRRQYYYQQQKAWELLADSYETGSEIKYNLFTNTYDDSIDSYDDYSQLWQSIASEYYFDDWTCTRTDGTPRLASAINDLNNIPLEEQMDTIANQVNNLRGLTTTNETSSKLMTRDEFLIYNEEEWFKDYDEEENNDSLTTLILLGLVEPDFDLKQMYLDSYGTNVLGFYDKDENTLVTISDTDTLTDAGKSTYAHEHMHALQFNTYDIEGIGYSDEGWETDSERAAAIQAVIEGEATLIDTLWKEAVFTSKNYDNEIEPPDADTEAPDISEPELPTWHLLDAYFPYGSGYNFVANVYSIGGWDAVNKLYEKPPVSTEMIMHPQKYLDDDVPIPVDAININNVLGQDWRKVESGVMGEFWTYLILREYIAEHHARIAAEGWGGDSYTVARNESNNQTFLAIDWVFDSTKDITEFYKALTTYNTSRFGNIDRQYMSSNQICSTGVLKSCVFQTGSTNIRWIVAPSIELIDKIFNEISGYNVYTLPTPEPTIQQPPPATTTPITQSISYPGSTCPKKDIWTDCGGTIDGIQQVQCADKEVGHCQTNLTWACKPDPTTCDVQVKIFEKAAKEGSASGCWDITWEYLSADGNYIYRGTTKDSSYNYTDYKYAYHDTQKYCRERTGEPCYSINIEAAEKCKSWFD